MVLVLQDTAAFAQTSPDTLQQTRIDPRSPALGAPVDTLGQPDSLARADTTVLDYSLSPDALDAEVKYGARDSSRIDVINQKIYLWGGARVLYGDLELTAGTMIIDQQTGLLTAEPGPDSAGVATELPNFKQGAQAFEAKGIRYNFETRKGIIYNATTMQGDLYVLGGRTKLVAADPEDPGRVDNTIYNSDAIFTTCDVPEHPHYGIRSNKQKVIPGKTVIVGPSNVELGGIPTPLWLPFGFFPIGSSERSGLIFPTDYTYTPVDGFGFQNIGWYFPFNDRVHTSLTTDLFLKGTTRFFANTDYNVRYRYSGNLDLAFSRNRVANDTADVFTNAYAFTWSHAQDPKANPYRTLRVSANFQGGGFARTNGLDEASQLTAVLRSNASYQIRFPEHPTWNLTTDVAHSQNTITKEGTLEAPSARFSTGSIYPFRDLGDNSRAWYKKAVIDYTASIKGSFEIDSTKTASDVLADGVFGGQHAASFSAPITVLKYFRLSPNVNYGETYYLKRLEREFVRRDTTVTTVDTVENVPVKSTETIIQDFERDTLIDGLTAAREFSTSLSLGTNVYGTLNIKQGPVRGVRHVIRPSVNLGYTPDYSAAPFDYYEEVQINREGDTERYLPFPTRPFSAGSLPDQLALRAGYSLTNQVQAKVRTRKDTTTRLVTLINNLSLSGSYNFAADTLRWSPINVSGGQFKLFGDIVRINFGGSFDVYDLDENGRRIDSTLFRKVRLDRANFQANVGLTFGQLRDIIEGEGATEAAGDDAIFSLIDQFTIDYSLTQNYDSRRVAEPWATTANSVRIAARAIKISPKWTLNGITFSYDLLRKDFGYPSLSVGRDLHCWQMDFNWYPAANAFRFSIRVKPSSLGFLELPYRRGRGI